MPQVDPGGREHELLNELPDIKHDAPPGPQQLKAGSLLTARADKKPQATRTMETTG
jgi:hypothetical protein